MSLIAAELKDKIICLYKDKEIRKNFGPLALTSDAFKAMGSKKNYRHAFGEQVKKLLEKDGYTLLDIHKSKEIIIIFRIGYLERKFNILDQDDLGGYA